MKETAHQPRKTPKKKSLKKEAAFLCSCCAAVLVFALATFNTSSFLYPNTVLGAKTQNLGPEDQGVYWQNLLNQYPNYIEGWIELSKIEFKAGNRTEAIKDLTKAKDIDPNSSEIKDLEKSLGLTL